MKNKMHTCLTSILLAGVLTVSVLGSVHNVYAVEEGKKTGSIKPKIVITKASVPAVAKVVKTTASSKGKITPTVEITANAGADNSLDLSGSIAGIPYSELAMANVEEAVNIRSEASEDSAISGKLFKNCGGRILESKEDWTRIESGDVTGWVSNDYLLFGSEAKKLAQEEVAKVAISKTGSLRLRMEPNEEAKILDLLAEGDMIDVIEEEGDWVKVEYSDGTECYVSAQYVDISYELSYGKSMETIKAEEAAQKAAANKAEGKSSETGSDNKSTEVKAVATAAGYDDVTLLAALIQCEAGGDIYEGQVSVGTAVMNRLKSGRYGSSLYSVIYAKSQFGPASTGKVAQVAAAGPKASCIAAANEALAGVSYIGNATSFRNVKSGHMGVVVGSHVFW
ncbi:MAG: SH3 domain-containing protein [Lachnospiraceae bacterium]|nr:SH3 domain-containing protein [Lachnospiraceae bacterium]